VKRRDWKFKKLMTNYHPLRSILVGRRISPTWGERGGPPTWINYTGSGAFLFITVVSFLLDVLWQDILVVADSVWLSFPVFVKMHSLLLSFLFHHCYILLCIAFSDKKLKGG
jgi:hypothetical protein